MCHYHNRTPLYQVNTDSFDGLGRHRSLTATNVFTDGGRFKDKTGCGFLVADQRRHHLLSKSFRLPDYASVFQAEISAVWQAAAALTSNTDLDLRYVKIFVDSQAALRALCRPLIKSRIVLLAIEALNKLAMQTKRLTLVWIPAHRGFFGNTQADTYAKLGVALPLDNAVLPVKRPSTSIKDCIRTSVYERWGKSWSDLPIASHAKRFYDVPDRNKAHYVLKLARLELGRFIRLISGHNNLNRFQCLLGLSQDPMCRLCGQAQETFLHFLYDCPRLMRARNDIFRDELPQPNRAWSVRELLCFSYIPTVNDAFEGT